MLELTPALRHIADRLNELNRELNAYNSTSLSQEQLMRRFDLLSRYDELRKVLSFFPDDDQVRVKQYMYVNC